MDVVLDVTGYFSVNAGCTDADHDDFFAQGAACGTPTDCNDANPAVHPGAPEVCGDGLDNDCNGVVDCGCAAAGRYVSTVIGNDLNPGTAQAPFKTIAKGIAAAVALGAAQAVLVAEGQYPDKVTLVEGISLPGTLFCGGIRTESATAIVTNNVVFGVKAPMSMAVLLEVPATVGTVVLNANYLDGGGEGLTGFSNSSAAVELRMCGTCGIAVILGSIGSQAMALPPRPEDSARPVPEPHVGSAEVRRSSNPRARRPRPLL